MPISLKLFQGVGCCQTNFAKGSIAGQEFLNSPHYLRIYGNESITPIDIFREVLQKDICEYYKIGEFLKSECKLDRLLYSFVFEEMVEVIRLIDHFYIGDDRDMYVETASELLGYAIESLCGNIDAYEFEPDVAHAIELSTFFCDDCEEVDTEKAASYIDEEIISDVEAEIDLQLSTLPDDIEYHQDYADHLIYSIFGTDDLVKSYLEYDGYDYDDYRESHGEYENPNSEIDYIFNRN